MSKFNIGDFVYASLGMKLGNQEVYTITRLLPAQDDGALYRIKTVNEPYERVVFEHQLTKKLSAHHGTFSKS